MSERLCHWCGSVIADKPTVLFCDKQCCNWYQWEHDEIPDEPRYKEQATA